MSRAAKRITSEKPVAADSVRPDSGGPLVLTQDEDTGDRLLIYRGNDGVRAELKVEGDTFWATQAQMAMMFGVDQSGISRHVTNILAEGELAEETAMRKLHSSRGGNLYNLNMLISVGYRVGGPMGTMFRIWATDKLFQYLTKGFVIDAPRLKAPGDYDRIAELREIIRDIRSAEANLYAELRRICSLCADYAPSSDAARVFYQRMQAKLYYAVVSRTPSEALIDRADAGQPNMGLRTWPKPDIRQEDATTAKNYLAEAEISELNRLTTLLLDIFDDQARIGKLTLMAEADALLDTQLANLNRVVLRGGGKVKSEKAIAHAKAEYAKFDAQRRAVRVEERREEIAALKAAEKALPKSGKTPTKRRS
jgi:hypothetical protein